MDICPSDLNQAQCCRLRHIHDLVHDIASIPIESCEAIHMRE